jgi:hypothetical protein
LESELFSPTSLCCPVIPMAPAVAADLPLLLSPLPELVLEELELELALVLALVLLLELMFALLLLLVLLDELELADWPPPVRVWSPPAPA